MDMEARKEGQETLNREDRIKDEWNIAEQGTIFPHCWVSSERERRTKQDDFAAKSKWGDESPYKSLLEHWTSS